MLSDKVCTKFEAVLKPARYRAGNDTIKDVATDTELDKYVKKGNYDIDKKSLNNFKVK